MTSSEHLYLQILVLFAIFLFSLIFVAVVRRQAKNRKQSTFSGARDALKNEATSKEVSTPSPERQALDQKEDAKPILGSAASSVNTAELPTATPTLGTVLKKSETQIWGRLKSWFGHNAAQRGRAWDELEEILYTSDLGPKTVQRLLQKLEDELPADSTEDDLKKLLKAELLVSLNRSATSVSSAENVKPEIWMIVGVNGAGKTTTIGKLAAREAQKGRRVLVAAGDTFRAAAGHQLKTWTERAQVEIFSPENVKDPSALAFDAAEKAKSASFDLLIVDTAGRLTTSKPLMDELAKMKRVVQPNEVFLVLDASSGQNAIHQANEFHQALGVTGVVLTKLDGSSKGGVAIALAEELGLGVRFVGVGEKISDIQDFSPHDFVKGLVAEV